MRGVLHRREATIRKIRGVSNETDVPQRQENASLSEPHGVRNTKGVTMSLKTALDGLSQAESETRGTSEVKDSEASSAPGEKVYQNTSS